MAYKKWKGDSGGPADAHLGEEELVCFGEARLSGAEKERVQEHLIRCNRCLEVFILNFGIDSVQTQDVPADLVRRVSESLFSAQRPAILEIFLKFTGKAVELLHTTGDILVGQELMPAPLLRSRKIKDFKDEVIILKDFKDISVEIKIENKGNGLFNLIILAKEKQTRQVIKDLRVTLFKEELQLESRLTDSGSVTFEQVRLGSYSVEIATIDNKLALISLDIKV